MKRDAGEKRKISEKQKRSQVCGDAPSPGLSIKGKSNLVQLHRTRIFGSNPMVIILVISTRGCYCEGFILLRSRVWFF